MPGHHTLLGMNCVATGPSCVFRCAVSAAHFLFPNASNITEMRWLTMAVKFTSVKCPECGANLPIEEGRERVFCSYCGTPVVITNENEKIIRHIDEAKIKRAETDRVIKYGQFELEKKCIERDLNDAYSVRKLQSALIKIWIVLVLIIFCICLWLMFREGGRGFFDAFLFMAYDLLFPFELLDRFWDI